MDSGVVYVGSTDGRIYALNAMTGAILWQSNTGGAIDSSPTVADGFVYVGSDHNHVCAFKAAQVPEPGTLALLGLGLAGLAARRRRQ